MVLRLPPDLAFSAPPTDRLTVLAIDIEPDGRADIRGDPCRGLHLSLEMLEDLRVRLRAGTGRPVHFNWFLRGDPQIEATLGPGDWLGRACPRLPDLIARHGDLTGIHPHFWKWDPIHQSWFNDFTDPDWLRHCIQRCIAAHRAAFGVRPISSRCGDRWLSPSVVAILREEGIRLDLTLEPGVPQHPLYDDPLATAPLPDFRRASRRPYQPSVDDYLVPAAEAAESQGGSQVAASESPGRSGPRSSLWMVPMATTSRSYWRLRLHPPYLVRSSQTCNLVLAPNRVWAHISAELKTAAPEPLCLTLRAGDLAQPAFRRNFERFTSRLLRHPNLARVRFARLDDAMDTYRAGIAPPKPSEVETQAGVSRWRT